MLFKNYKQLVVALIFLLSTIAYAQDIRVLVPYDGSSATEIFNQIIADTTQYHGIPADRVYMLQAGQIYICTQQFYVPNGQTLKLQGTKGAKPVIYLYPTGTGANPQNPPGMFVRTRGGNLSMKGIAIAGIFEPDTAAINNMQGGLLRTDNEGSSIYVDDCVMSNVNGQFIRTEAAAKTVKVTNSIFTNLGFLGNSNFGAGKGIDLRATSCDSLILVNNTFTNYQDRIVRHYNLSVGGTGNIGYTLIEHNTFYSGMGFHGLLSLGDVGKSVTITNNLFVDAFALGEDSTDRVRATEFGNFGETYPNGVNRLVWIFTAPNDTTQWKVSNNFWSVSAGGQSFFDAHSFILGPGSQLTWHINKRLGADSTTAFTKIDDPVFEKRQDLMLKLMNWYEDPAGGNKTKDRNNWTKLLYDMDRKPLAFWTDTLNCAYSTSSLAYTGAEKGFPAGDLNWYPTLKALWDEGGTVDVEEQNAMPTQFSLEQNYPNPFNPTTQIEYTVPKEAKIKLEIFDVLGRSVETLVNQVQVAGTYSAKFDASRLTSGIYFYRLSAPQQVITKKMMLIK